MGILKHITKKEKNCAATLLENSYKVFTELHEIIQEV